MARSGDFGSPWLQVSPVGQGPMAAQLPPIA
jgi:hypothetical protein